MQIDGTEYYPIETAVAATGYALSTLENYFFTKKIPGRKLKDGRIVFSADNITKIKEIKDSKPPAGRKPVYLKHKEELTDTPSLSVQEPVQEEPKVIPPPEYDPKDVGFNQKKKKKEYKYSPRLSFTGEKGQKVYDCAKVYAEAKGVHTNQAVVELLADALKEKKELINQIKQVQDQMENLKKNL